MYGTLAGYGGYETLNIFLDNIEVISSGNYAGGVFGYCRNDSVVEQKNINITNSDITGNQFVGGITGYSHEIGLTNNNVTNTNINGTSYVGGMAGRKYVTDAYRCNNNTIINCTITGSGSEIGGLNGYSESYEEDVLIKNSKIYGATTDSDNVGGVLGSLSYRIWRARVINCEVVSLGNSVGGVAGYDAFGNGIHAPERCYVENTKVEGRSKVGGLVGEIRDGNLIYCTVNAEVNATLHTAGGILGYIDNTDMTEVLYLIRMNNNSVLNSNISAPTKVGGLVGDVSKDLLSDLGFYINNYVHAYIESEDTESVSMGVGGAKTNNSSITNTYVYKYSQINGDYVYASNDTYEEKQYLVEEDLKLESTYRSKLSWGETFNYESLKNNKYPIPTNITDVEGIDLPTDPEIVDLNSLDNKNDNEADTSENSISTQNIEALPEIIVYPISINEINIDFSNITDNTSFTCYINGSEIDTIDLTEKTYTFEYNFIDILEIVVTNGIDDETITINPSEIRSEISLVGDNYAYLIGKNLYINGELQSGEYVNVYEGYALNTSGQAIDLATNEIVNSNITEVKLEEASEPLHTYEYKGSSIEVYGTYSKIDGNIKSQIYNVRSGKLSAISNDLDMKIDNYIVDQYNDKEYQTILTNSGEIVDLKEQLQYPNNFLSRNIKQIVQNSNAENTDMMVIYNTGKVIVFNYVNGNVIYETEEQADSGLANYITGSINSIWSDYEDKQSEYARSKALIAKLTEMPIEEVLNEVEENTNNADTNNSVESINNIITNNINSSITNNTANKNEESYITVYNGETGEYEVYSETEILEGIEEDPVSETEKIKENGLESIYNYEKEEETGTKVNGAIIVVSIIGIAIISLIILRKLIYRNNTKK